MGADHLIALAVVAAPGAPERRKRRDVESRGGDYRAEDEDDDDDENDDERTTRFGARPGLRRALHSAMLGVQWGWGHALGLALVSLLGTSRATNRYAGPSHDGSGRECGSSHI